MEALSLAYVEAVAACCGLICTAPARDYGIDLTLRSVRVRGGRHFDEGIALDLQVKASTRATIDRDGIAFDLDAKAYKDLCDPSVVAPRILVLLVLPAAEESWLVQSEELLSIFHCAYWISLRGRTPTDAAKSARIVIPRTQTFFVSGVLRLMERLRKGEDL
jgi:hypothetical protein